jgi:hypothetical protein
MSRSRCRTGESSSPCVTRASYITAIPKKEADTREWQTVTTNHRSPIIPSA